MTRSPILDKAYAEERAYLATVERLALLESPTHDKAACDAVATALADMLTSDGWTIERHRRATVGDIIEARMTGGAYPGAGTPTLLLAHYDTVWPVGTLAQMPVRRDGDVFSGPGTVDMKAGIACAIHAVRIAAASDLPLQGDVTLLVTSDEEVGSAESRSLIEELALKHDRVLVLEPGREDGALKIGRKGTGGYQVSFMGKSAHAGNNPSDGASALRELSHFLLYVEDLADDVAGTTVNLTQATGGFAANVIAEEATAVIDLRVLRANEMDRVDRSVKAYQPRDARVTLRIEGGLNRPPLETSEPNRRLHAAAEDAARSLGLTLDAAIVGGGSDGNFTSALGVATLDGLGSVGAGAHARHEHIRIRESLERVALLTALLTGS
jgi:glutamate carboxypeptidase